MFKKTRKSSMQHIFFGLFCLLIFISPFPLGSNRIWAWSLEATFASTLLVAMISCSQLSSSCDFSWHRLRALSLEFKLIGLWLFVMGLYIIPLPLLVLNIITPNIAQSYGDLGLSYGYMSLDVYASYKMLLLSCYFTLVFILGTVLINSRKRITIVLFIMILLGVFEAVYGMYLVSIGKTGTLVQVNSVSMLHASGTFINKNHLVAFLSLSFILGLGLRLILSRSVNRYEGMDLKVRFVRFISHPIRFLDVALFLIATGVWNTHSRAGLSSFLVALLFYFVLLLLAQKNKTFSIKKIILVFGFLMVVMVFVSDDINFFMESLGQKSDDSSAFLMESAKGRLLAVDQAITHMSNYWLSGVGPGAYQVFFVNHRSVEQMAYFDHAHNDYIEFIVEFGVFSLILASLVVIFFYRLFVFVFAIKSQFYKLLAISILSSLVYLLFHGIFDFNARIPANVVTIIVALSLLYGKMVSLVVNNR